MFGLKEKFLNSPKYYENNLEKKIIFFHGHN